MSALAGGLLLLPLVWLVMLPLMRWTKDIPFAVRDIRATGEALRESERQTVEAQNRVYRFWRTKGLWIAGLGFVAGIVLAVIQH
jgi:hypothetical protein